MEVARMNAGLPVTSDPNGETTGICVANLAGAEATPNDWAVVSLCRVGERFVDHRVRRADCRVTQSDRRHTESRIPAGA
jgi:hypothetical protein